VGNAQTEIGKGDLRSITNDHCAEAATCIIAAWTYRVRGIDDLECGEDQEHEEEETADLRKESGSRQEGNSESDVRLV